MKHKTSCGMPAKSPRRQFHIVCMTEAYIYAENKDDASKQAEALGRGEKIESLQPPCTIYSAEELPRRLHRPDKKAGK